MGASSRPSQTVISQRRFVCPPRGAEAVVRVRQQDEVGSSNTERLRDCVLQHREIKGEEGTIGCKTSTTINVFFFLKVCFSFNMQRRCVMRGFKMCVIQGFFLLS